MSNALLNYVKNLSLLETWCVFQYLLFQQYNHKT